MRLSVGPRGVDFDPFDEDVGVGCGETAVVEEGEEAGLELASGVGCGLSEVRDSFLGGVAGGEFVCAGQAPDLGLVDGALQLVFGEDAGEVELGAGGGGDGDGVVGGDLVGWEDGSVEEQPGSGSACAWGRDLDAAFARSDAPEGGGGSVAQDSVGREDGGHPSRSL